MFNSTMTTGKVSTTVSKESIVAASEKPLTGTESFYTDFPDYMLSPDDTRAFRASSSFAETNQPWGKLSIRSPKAFGYLIGNADPLTTLDHAPTVEEFYEHTKQVFNDRTDGWEWSEVNDGEDWITYFLRRAEEWYNFRPVKVSKETAFTEVFIRIIQQSWEGLLSEMAVKVIIAKNLQHMEEYANYPEDTLELHNPTKKLDHNFNCDVIVWNKRKDAPEFGIQIKPERYFHISAKTERDKKKNRQKDLSARKQLGLNIYYIDKTKVLNDEPIHMIKSESVVSPYEVEGYNRWNHKGYLNTVSQNSVGEFKKNRIRSPYYGY